MESRFSSVLSIILVIAIVVIIGVLGFFGYKVLQSNDTTQKANDIVSEFDQNTGDGENVENTTKPDNNTSSDENTTQPGTSLDDILNNLGEGGSSGSIYDQSGKKDTYYEGYKVIGTISIPSINIEYPILEENTSAALKIAIVPVHPRDPANAVNKVGNLVLWGHNYKNGTFFSDIGKLTTGAKIYIKDTTGTKVEYKVYNSYETTDSDMTYATRDTEGTREITLSTCANEAGKRIIVWARET